MWIKLRKKYINLQEAARTSGYSSDYIGCLIRNGKIKGKKIYTNASWQVSSKEIMEYCRKNKGLDIRDTLLLKKKDLFLKEAAQISGYAPDYIGYLIRKGKIPGKKVYSGPAWLTTEKAIKKYQEKSEIKNEKLKIGSVREQPITRLVYDIFPPEKIQKAAREITGWKPYKTKFEKIFALGWRLVLVVTILFLLIGIGPTEIFQRVIDAFTPQETKTINFYGTLCEGDPEGIPAGSYGASWQNHKNVEGEPNISADGDFNSFSEANSAVYQGGSSSLVCQNFNTNNELKNLQFQSAKIKFSFAIGEKKAEFTPLLETPSSEETPPEIPPPEPVSPPAEGTEPEVIPSENTTPNEEDLIQPPQGTETKPEKQEETIPQPEETPKEESSPSSFLDKIKNFFGILVTKAQEDIPLIETTTPPIDTNENISGEILPNIDAKIIIWYSFDGETWWQLDTISSYPLSNFLNGGYFSFDAPFLKNWDDIKNLKIKFEGVIGGETNFTAYLDSVWIEATYSEQKEKIEEPKKIFKIKIKDNSLVMTQFENSFSINEEPTFVISEPELPVEELIKTEKGEIIEEMPGPQTPETKKSILENVKEKILEPIIDLVTPEVGAQAKNIKTKIFGPDGAELSILPTINSIFVNGKEESEIKIPKSDREFRPGLYKLEIEFETKDAIYVLEQDFSWGVLAINTNKSIYLPGETAYLQMAALNEDGHTICDANLQLEITSPSGKIEIPEVKTSGDCGPDNVTQKPDYFAYYQVEEVGTYKMQLKNLNNGYEISESFEVRDSVTFDVERIGPTRIYPPASYEMKMIVKANQDFTGQVIEPVPPDFEIIETGGSRQETKDEEKLIIWDVDWKKGESYELSYQFDASDISPYLYLLGPLEIGQFKEARFWQIAADTTSGPNNPGTTANVDYGGGNAWANTDCVKSHDTSRATVTMAQGVNSDYIWTTNFGFSLTSCASIDGIKVEVERNGPVSLTIYDASVRIIQGGSVVGTEKADATDWPVAEAYFTYGGTTDKWGATWVCSDIDGNANFGVAVAASNQNTGSRQARVNHIRITVYYTQVSGITVSGNAYADEATTFWSACNGSTQNISLAVNGTVVQTASCVNGTGVYSFTGVTVAAGNEVAVFMNATDKGTAATVAKDVSTTPITLNPRKGRVWVKEEASAPSNITNTLLHKSDKAVADCGNVPYTISDVTNALTVDDTYKIVIETGKTFAPDGNVTTPAMEIMATATYTAGSYTLILSSTGSGTTCTADAGTMMPLCIVAGGVFTASTDTVQYSATTGSLTVAVATYNNLTLSNTSGTDTAGGIITVNTALTTTASGTLDMDTYQLLGAFTPTNGGTLKTSSTADPAIPTGKTWTGTVQFALATGGQYVPAGTYTTLTFSNTSGTDTAGGALATTTFNTTAGGTVNMATYALTATTVSHAGILQTQNTSAAPIPTGKTWGGTVDYRGDGAMTIVAGTYYDLLAGVNATLTTDRIYTLGGDTTITHVLTVGPTSGVNILYLAGSTYTLTLSGSGTPFVINSSGTFTASSSTVKYTGTAATNITATTYNNLELSPSSSATATLYPNGNVSVVLTPYPIDRANWDCVNETPADDTDYVGEIDQTTFQDDLYTTPSPSIPAGSTINSVTVYFRVEKSGTKVSSARPRIRALAQTITDGTAVGLDDVWANKSQSWTTNPQTGVAWTVDEVNDLDIGVGMRQTLIGETSGLCSQLYAVVDYVPTYTLGTAASQNITTNGYLTIGDGTNPVSVTAATNDPNLNIDGDLTISANATLTASDSGSATFTVAGNWLNSGIFTHSNGTVTFDSSTTGKTINNGSSSFYNVIFNNATGGWSFSATGTISNNLTMTAGTLSSGGTPYNITVNGGSVVCGVTCGTINLTGAIFNLNGTGNFGSDGLNPNWTFYDLTFGSGSSGTTTSQGGGTVTVSHILTISTSQTLNAGSKVWTLSGAGTPFSISGTFTPSTSTVVYSGSSTTNVTSTTYYNLNIGGATTTATYTAAGNITVNSVLTIVSSSGTNTFNASSYTITLAGAGIPFVITGTFTPSTSTVVYSGSSTTNVTSTTYYNLNIGGAGTTTTYTAAGDITVTNVLTIVTSSGTNTFDASNKTITLSGTGTPFVINTSEVFTANTSTVKYTGTAATNITATIYNNLELVPSSSSATATLYPNGAGDETTLSPYPTAPNWDCVNETPADDTDYVSETDQTFFQSDLYTTPSPSIPTGSTINSVTVYFRVEKIGTRTSYASPRIRALAQESTIGTAVTLTDGVWANESQTWTTNPVTSAAWTVNEVNDLDIGINLKQSTTGETSGLCSQLYAVINYTPTYYTLGTAASQNLPTNGYLTIGDGTHLVTVTADTNDPTLDVNSNFTISASATFIASATGTFIVGGNWSNSATGTFTHSSGTVTFDATTTGKTISDGGDEFYDLQFTGDSGGWTYTDGASTAPHSTTVDCSSCVATFVNAKTGTSPTVTDGTLNVDWYLGVRVIDAASDPVDPIEDIVDGDVTISENTAPGDGGPYSTIWKYSGGWGDPAASKTTSTDGDGNNPQPNNTGAIRVREYSMTASASCPGAGCTLYKYNLQIAWQSTYGEYNYYTDHGQNYLTSCWAGTSNACSNDTTDDDVIGSSWYRSTIGTMNTPYVTVNEPPTNGSWYIGMFKGLEVTITGTSIGFGTLDATNNFTAQIDSGTTITVTTSATSGYIVTAWETQLMTCSAANCGVETTIQNFTYCDYSNPCLWATLCKDNANYCGFGFTSNDPEVGGESSRYGGGTEYTYFPNDSANPVRVMDYGGPVSSKSYSITYRISASLIQRPGPYSTTIVYIITAQY
jgi:hypothetical protein